MKKTVIIGKDSFIGLHLYNFLSKQPNLSVDGTTINDLDITNENQISQLFKENHYDIILLLAGLKDVKKLEANPELGYKLNVEPVKNFIKYITNEKLIYFSSDYVFDGKQGQYKVNTPTSPVTVYGKNKAEAENILKNSKIDYSIIRTAAVLGKNSTFLNWLIDTLRQQEQVEMFSNSYFTPTCINFLCEAVAKIIELNEKTIYHIVQEKRLSRLELAELVQSLLHTSCKIISGETTFVDHSLVQSDVIKNMTNRSFESYLQELLTNV